MVTDVLQSRPKSAHEELRFESAQRAAHLYERAKLVCKIVIVAAVALLLTSAAASTILGPQGDTVLSLPAVSFVCVVGLLFTFAYVWSSRVHRDTCCDTYAKYVGSK
ncbi:MAG TPA: hypothetical protein VGZ26_00810 [Pirellulales bacterium]|nr:hypothetical protein [Pirellulales bacterium]